MKQPIVYTVVLVSKTAVNTWGPFESRNSAGDWVTKVAETLQPGTSIYVTELFKVEES